LIGSGPSARVPSVGSCLFSTKQRKISMP